VHFAGFHYKNTTPLYEWAISILVGVLLFSMLQNVAQRHVGIWTCAIQLLCYTADVRTSYAFLTPLWVTSPTVGASNTVRGLSCNSFLGAFAKLRKVTISFVMSVCPYVETERLGSHWTDFHELWYFSVLLEPIEQIQVLLKSDKNSRYFTWSPICILHDISPSFSQNEKIFRQKL
jgi:hypothetical protein